MANERDLGRRIDRIFDVASGGLRSLSRPATVVALSLVPALCLAAALDFGPSPSRSWRSAPLRIAMYFQGERIGKLDRFLTPGEVGQTEPMKPATAEQRAGVPLPPTNGDPVFIGKTFLVKGRSLQLALVEHAEGQPYLFADVDLNGSFESRERFEFARPRGRSLLPHPQVTLDVQLPIAGFPTYPVRIFLPNEDLYKSQEDNPGGRYLLRAPFQLVYGTVEIGGKAVRTLFMFDPQKAGSWVDYGFQGMDLDGDGWIRQGANSEEFTFAHDESIVFHLNGHAVSMSSVDLKAGTFAVRERSASDYTYIRLKLGEALKDFDFTGMDGKPHRLSDFRGKYVLLDFWGTWCGPCRVELPELEKAWQQFRGRGLVILGIDEDDDIEKPRKLLAEKGVTYPQALPPGSRDLVLKRFRISAFPTLVLLDPEGKIISVDSNSLRGENLPTTLDRLLPAARE